MMLRHFYIGCTFSRQTLQELTWLMAVVDGRSVDDWSNAAPDLSKYVSSCCDLAFYPLQRLLSS